MMSLSYFVSTIETNIVVLSCLNVFILSFDRIEKKGRIRHHLYSILSEK